jgi:hypothetical protein
MTFYLKSFALCFILFPAAAFAQDTIPPGTVLPAQLSSSLNSQKRKPGQTITARIMQDVPTSPRRRIRAGAKVTGHVMMVKAAKDGQPGEITLRFEKLNFAHQSIPISTSLRALASMMEVDEAQVPPGGTDRGTPWAWRTRNLIGGEVAYGDDGPVARGTDIVGSALAEGVLLSVKANPGSGCRGEVAGNSQPQALWVFSSDACGVYGLPEVQITHAGRTAPFGEITLTSKQKNLELRSGSGILLRVNSPNPP